jgi:IPT/TIG domain
MPITTTEVVPARFRAVTGYYDAAVPTGLLVEPTVISIAPTTAVVGDPDLTLTVTGTDVSEYSVILFNGAAEPTVFVPPDELTTTVKPSTVTEATTVPVQVRNGVQVSNAQDFTFSAAQQADPTGVTAGAPGAFTPDGAAVPATIGDLRALGIGSGPAWVTGEYVVIGSGNAHWDGADWVMGIAP